MSIIKAAGAGDQASTGFYDTSIGQSLRFNKADSPRLMDSSVSSDGNRRKFTFSFWVKLSKASDLYDICIGAGGSASYPSSIIGFHNQRFTYKDYRHPSYVSNVITTAVFRDVSAWYHFVCAVDTTQSTAADRVKMYVNGTQLTEFDTSSYPSQNYDTLFQDSTSGNEPTIGFAVGFDYMDGYLADVYNVDNAQLAPTEFGETKDGVWVPKEYSGSFGTTGYHLTFSDSSSIGADSSGNSHSFDTVTNLAASDVVLDSPTNSFPTWNSLQPQGAAQGTNTLSEGNLKAGNSANKYGQSMGSMSVLTGKWYTETYISDTGYPSWHIGWTYGSRFEQFDGGTNDDEFFAGFGYFTGSSVYFTSFGETYAALQKAYSGIHTAGDAPTTGDVIGCAADFDNGKFWWHINGEYLDVGSGAGDPANGTNPARTFTVATYADKYKSPWVMNYNGSFILNAGQDSTFAGAISAGGNSDENGNGDFKYSVPSGFLALCSSNLPDVTIGPGQSSQANEHFDTVLYTGNGSSSKRTDITYDSLIPDWVWVKQRSSTQDHALHDTVRGSNKKLEANNTDAEVSGSGFGTDGLGGASNNGTTELRIFTADAQYNASSATYVAWGWKAGTSVSGTTTGSGTGQAYTGSVNTDAGFSIIAYTGNGTAGHTIPHHLGVAPKMVISKKRSATGSWGTYHDGLSSASYYILLNDSAAQASNTVYFNGTAPTDSVVTRGTGADGNANGVTYVQYAFAEIDGYSRITSYVGNASTDGTFCYLGHRPAWLMVKNASASGAWYIFDVKRNTFNEMDKYLRPNISNAEGTLDFCDFTSNGFKIRSSAAEWNGSGNTIIVLSFAEQPFKFANAR